MDQKEGMKPSKQEEKQMKGNNPEREVLYELFRSPITVL